MQIPGHDAVPSRATRPWVAAAAAATLADTAGTVRFPSREAFERSGIEVVPVETRPTVLRTTPYLQRTN